MKRILLLLMLLCSIGVSAQDVIVKKDGSTIICRVVEINQTNVVYKKWSNQQGPNYVIAKVEVASVNYENGEKDVFEETSTPTQSAVIAPVIQNNNGQQTVSDDVLLKMVGGNKKIVNPERGKKIKKVGFIAGPILIVSGIVMTVKGCDTDGNPVGNGYSYYYWDYHLACPGLLASGIVCLAGGVATTTGCLIRAHNIKKNSLYSVQSAPLYQQDFHLKNGTSFSPSINMIKDNTRRNTTLGIGLTYNF